MTRDLTWGTGRQFYLNARMVPEKLNMGSLPSMPCTSDLELEKTNMRRINEINEDT